MKKLTIGIRRRGKCYFGYICEGRSVGKGLNNVVLGDIEGELTKGLGIDKKTPETGSFLLFIEGSFGRILRDDASLKRV